MSELVGFPHCSRNAVLFPCAHLKMKDEVRSKYADGDRHLTCLEAYGPYALFRDCHGIEADVVIIIKPEGCTLYL